MSATTSTNTTSIRTSFKNARTWLVQHAKEHNASVTAAYEAYYGAHSKPPTPNWSPKAHNETTNSARTSIFGTNHRSSSESSA